jgi:hypothetical protein
MTITMESTDFVENELPLWEIRCDDGTVMCFKSLKREYKGGGMTEFLAVYHFTYTPTPAQQAEMNKEYNK